MIKAFDFCIPTKATKVPHSPDWIHEIKYDGYAWYLFVHHCAHHSRKHSRFPLLKHHRSHHKFATRNYGVSTTLWDHVFGTVLR
jgi:hypothetical protein